MKTSPSEVELGSHYLPIKKKMLQVQHGRYALRAWLRGAYQ